MLIARFYQRSSGERTYYRLYIVPIVLFGGGIARYTSINFLAGDTLGDLLLAVSGLLLIALCVFLYHIMMRKRKTP
jgi:hypothetical protein